MCRVDAMRRLACTLTPVLLLGCGAGGQSTQTTTAESDPTVVVPGSPGASIATGDLSPVPAPAELLAVGRVRSPAKLAEIAGTWANYPLDVAKLLDQEKPGISRVVKLDAPVEIILSLDPAAPKEPVPFVVVSVGLVSLDAAVSFARDQGERVDEVRAGVYAVGNDCLVSSALGAAPARLVCGESQKDLDALAAYAARGLPSEPLADADLHFEMRAEPVRRLYGDQLRRGRTLFVPMVLNELQQGDARFDRALADAVHALADELLALVEDLDALKITANVNPATGMATGSFHLAFRGSRSWVAATLADAGTRASTAPEIFFGLPVDAGVASWSIGANPKRFDAILSTGVELADGALGSKQVPPRVRTELVDLLRKIFVSGASSAYAGSSRRPDDAAIKRLPEHEREVELMKAGFGWHVVGVDEEPRRWKALLDQLARVATSRDLRAFGKKMGGPMDDLPTVKTRGARGLAGATTYEVVVPPQERWTEGGKVKTKPISFFVVLAPDGARTWMGASFDEALVVSKLAATRKGAPSTGKLAAREGLDTLKSTKAISGGFFTLMSLVQGVGPLALAAERASVSIDQVFNSMPHHGETPMFQFTRVDAGPTLTITTTVPKNVVQDLVSGAVELGLRR